MRIRKSVGAIIKNTENKILLVHKVRIMDGKFPIATKEGEWVFPQGGVKDGESSSQALKREIFEETNITEFEIIKDLPSFEFEFKDEVKKILNYDKQTVEFFEVLYKGDYKEIQPDFYEIDKLEFVSYNEALDVLFHQSSKEYLRNNFQVQRKSNLKLAQNLINGSFSSKDLNSLSAIIDEYQKNESLDELRNADISNFNLRSGEFQHLNGADFYNSLFSYLIYSGDGDYFKTANWIKLLFKQNSYLKKEISVSIIIDRLISIAQVNESKKYYSENIKRIQKIKDITSETNKNDLLKLIKELCIADDNQGKLSGKVEVENNIVYHKRDGNEFSINFTNKCPNACTFCIRDFSAGWSKDNLYLASDPTVLEIKNAVKDELDRWGDNLHLIKFCGYGEPLLRPDAIVEVAKFIGKFRKGVNIQINTSGWPYYKYADKYLKRFKDSGITTFSISLNAPDKISYDKIVRPGVFEKENNAFENTLKFTKECVAMGFTTKVTIVKLANMDQQKINDIEKFVNSLGARFIARAFVGDFEKIRTDKKQVEIETKVLHIERDMLLSKFNKLGIKLIFRGVSKITNYTLPDTETELIAIKILIDSNPVELREYFELLKVLSKTIQNKANLNHSKGFIRVKEENNKVYLVYKEPYFYTSELKYENELKYQVESYEKADEILTLIGLHKSVILERFRESYTYAKTSYNIDKWPGLQPYLKIEGKDEMSVYNGFNQLNLNTTMKGVHTSGLYNEENKNEKNILFSVEEKKQITMYMKS